MKPLAIAGLTILLFGPPVCQAQEDIARQHIEAGLARAASGDTAGAIAELRSAIDAAPSLADAHFQLGRLLARHASTVETDLEERREAEEALRRAFALDPRNPAYLAELGWLHIKQNLKNDAERVLKRALASAEERGVDDHTLLADIYYGLGYLEDLRYEGLRDRALRPPLPGDISTQLDLAESGRFLYRYIEDYLEDTPSVVGAGQETRARMMEYYQAVLRHDPTHPGATQRVLLHLLDQHRISEYVSIAKRLAAAQPQRPEAQLYLGLGLHAAGREDEAAAAFERALALLPPAERAPYLSLEPVMRRRPAEDYETLDARARERFESLYWRLSDPLYLTDANERRLEHLARVTYADMRFSEPESGLHGWETDRGVIFIRYGPPRRIARFRSPSGLDPLITIVWAYGEQGPAFMFRQPAGFQRARFAGDYHWLATQERYLRPATYDSIPSIPAFFSIPVQLARFRGDSVNEVALEVHAELPLEDLAQGVELQTGEMETGFFVLNRAGERIVRRVTTEVLTYADVPSKNPVRSWRLLLPPSGQLVAAVEARDAGTWRAAAARASFTPIPFPDDSLSISDILLAHTVRPLAAEPVRRVDFDIDPNPSREYATDQPVHIYYELYGFERDSEGFANYDVALTVRVAKLYREGILAELLGPLADAWGFTIVGDDRLELRYSREVDVGDRDRIVEFLSLELERAPAGEYEINLRIRDRLGERMASQTRTFTVAKQH
jgi:GWxTD domain-containing protein